MPEETDKTRESNSMPKSKSIIKTACLFFGSLLISS